MMDIDRTDCKQTNGECRRGTNRRSLPALIAAGVGALVSLPARAQEGSAAFNTETRSFADLKKQGPERQVRTIQYASGSYHVVTVSGNRTEFAEADLRFKVDSSAMGPRRGEPVILPAGQVGDPALVFFAAPQEISTFIAHQD